MKINQFRFTAALWTEDPIWWLLGCLATVSFDSFSVYLLSIIRCTATSKEMVIHQKSITISQTQNFGNLSSRNLIPTLVLLLYNRIQYNTVQLMFNMQLICKTSKQFILYTYSYSFDYNHRYFKICLPWLELSFGSWKYMPIYH